MWILWDKRQQILLFKNFDGLKKNVCEQAIIQIEKLSTLLDRFQYWVVYFQTIAARTVSSILHLMDDFHSVADSLADKSNNDANVKAEAILIWFLAQIVEKFEIHEVMTICVLLDFQIQECPTVSVL